MFNVNFIDGVGVNVTSLNSINYKIQFIDRDTNKTEYLAYTDQYNNSAQPAIKKYFINWNVKVYDGNTLVFEHQFNPKGKKVYISFDSKSLGDMIAWFPYAEEFRKKWDCELIVSTFSNELFEGQYPNIKFIKRGEHIPELYALYRLGIFYDKDDNVDYLRHISDPIKETMQKIASDILGLQYKEIRPKLKTFKVKKKKLVTIAIHSTAQLKYWNNKNGWQEVVNFLVSKGYEVRLLSREENGYMDNWHPINITQQPDGSLDDVIKVLHESQLFIGIGSGLSWLSWATKTKTILISGFSERYFEMNSGITRISAPVNICGGCYNRRKLDIYDWWTCPDHKGTSRQFECTKSIESSDVIKEIKLTLNI